MHTYNREARYPVGLHLVSQGLARFGQIHKGAERKGTGQNMSQKCRQSVVNCRDVFFVFCFYDDIYDKLCHMNKSGLCSSLS